MNIIATKVKGKDLKAGDLFSTVGQVYWDASAKAVRTDPSRIGEKVYIRTNSPCPKDQENVKIHRIEITQ